ncbi:hypothetical protein GCM10027168_48830 [Streptomyces capparidis]
MDDIVTGARAEVALTVDLPPEEMWELVTDVSGFGRWSPECTHAEWLDTAAPGPRAGARFEGRSRYRDGCVSSVVCVVTEAVRPVTFAWAVLDERDDPARPASIWRYELSPATAGRTLVRHTFLHGPGASGTRDGALRDPAALPARLARMRGNMTATLAAMVRDRAAAGATGGHTTTEEDK